MNDCIKLIAMNLLFWGASLRTLLLRSRMVFWCSLRFSRLNTPRLLGICFLGEGGESIMRGGDRGDVWFSEAGLIAAAAEQHKCAKSEESEGETKMLGMFLCESDYSTTFLRRKIRASPARPSKATPDGSGTAVIVKPEMVARSAEDTTPLIVMLSPETPANVVTP